MGLLKNDKLDENLYRKESRKYVEKRIPMVKKEIEDLKKFIESGKADKQAYYDLESQMLFLNALEKAYSEDTTEAYLALASDDHATRLRQGFAGQEQDGGDWIYAFKPEHMNSEYLGKKVYDKKKYAVDTGQRKMVNVGGTEWVESEPVVKNIKAGKRYNGREEPIEEPAPEPTPTPQVQTQQAPSQRLTTDTTPAEFKPALMEKEKAKTEEEYLGKDRSKWANMSTADKVAGLAGLLGDAGGDIVDIVAAAQGIENGGAERLKKRRDEINQRREERKREYQEYLNRVDDINRQIAMHNNNTINNSAMAKFNADNAYRMINYQAQQQAAAQAAAGLYN